MIRHSTTAIALVFAMPALAQPVEQGPKNAPQFEPAFENQTRAPAMETEAGVSVAVVTDGLSHPWGIEVMPDGQYLVTERSGQLRIVSREGEASAPISNVPDVLSRDQGGLLDVALAPDFEDTREIFLTYAKPLEEGQNGTAAARAVLSEDGSELTDVQEIFVQSPPAEPPKHFGSRIILDDEYAYITTGEHSSDETRVFAQDLDKTYGKIIRVRHDGTVPDDNPFVDQEGAQPEIWSTGHRNIQGADIRPSTGELWGLEHGPKGGDELNLIEPGENYGWPVVSYGIRYDGGQIGSGEPRQEGFVEPRYYWDPVIAPGGFVFYEGEIFPGWEGNVLASSLNPGALVRLVLDGETVTGEERLVTDRGRIRDVEIDQDGAVLLLTDKANGEILRVTAAE